MQVETLTFDQVHLGVPDPEAAANWYRQYLDATPGDHTDRVMFGPTRFIFLKNDAPAPSLGAAIDHVGVSFPDVHAQMARLDGSGMRVTTATNDAAGVYRSAVIEDPWGARIEVLEDPEARGFHHVHLQVPDPDEARRWYLEMFGGRVTMLKGKVEGIKYGDVWLFTGRGAAEPSGGHTLDHIGWRMPDLLASAAALKAKGVRFTTDPHPGPEAPHAPALMSFTADPWGVKIELLQRGVSIPT
jgi:catechol 2,3-dioxygenase-like lactoylglutathione lyase family enzyme